MRSIRKIKTFRKIFPIQIETSYPSKKPQKRLLGKQRIPRLHCSAAHSKLARILYASIHHNFL